MLECILFYITIPYLVPHERPFSPPSLAEQRFAVLDQPVDIRDASVAMRPLRPEYGDLVALDVPRGELRMDSPAEGGIGAGQPVYKAFIFPERHNNLDDPRGTAGLLLARHAWTLLWGFPRSDSFR